MRRSGEDFRTIWQKPDDPAVVQIIDQRRLPHEYVVADLTSWRDGVHAISEMLVRGAPLIGATAAWSLYLAALESRGTSDRGKFIRNAASGLAASRPTAVNLRWAIDRVLVVLDGTEDVDAIEDALQEEARKICDEDIDSLVDVESGAFALLGRAVDGFGLSARDIPVLLRKLLYTTEPCSTGRANSR